MNNKITKIEIKLKKSVFCGKHYEMFGVLAKFHHGITFMKSWQKKIIVSKILLSKAFWSADFFLYHEFHECYSTMKICKHSKHSFMLATKRT